MGQGLPALNPATAERMMPACGGERDIVGAGKVRENLIANHAVTMSQYSDSGSLFFVKPLLILTCQGSGPGQSKAIRHAACVG
jgi:hypothetical protein